MGPLCGARVLDTGCGDGYLARILAARGARVTGIDISPRLIGAARRKDIEGRIDYRVADLTRPLLEEEGAFDSVGSCLVLSDVRNYRAFIATLAGTLKGGGRLVLALDNPYAAVIHHHVADYFATGARNPCRGLWADGIKTYVHHRTLQNYLDAGQAAHLQLRRLVDLEGLSEVRGHTTGLSEEVRFPRFMLLAFVRS